MSEFFLLKLANCRKWFRRAEHLETRKISPMTFKRRELLLNMNWNSGLVYWRFINMFTVNKKGWFTLATEAESKSEESSDLERKRTSYDPAESDSVELPTQLPIPLFDLHWVVTLLLLPIPTPLPIPSLVWTSPNSIVSMFSETYSCLNLRDAISKWQVKRKIRGTILNHVGCLPCTLQRQSFIPYVKKRLKGKDVFRSTWITCEAKHLRSRLVFKRNEGKISTRNSSAKICFIL